MINSLRRFTHLLTFLLTLTLYPFADVHADNKIVTIGFQKGSGLLAVLKAQGTLEKTLETQKIQLNWIEFPAGPQLLEALHTGNVDFGYTGAPPPVFAQAAGVELMYVGAEPASPGAEAIVVQKDSPIKNVNELKGKKIAFQKGSSANLLIVTALRRAGLTVNDITPVYLTPADARAAFISGSVDAWAIWDPYFAAIAQSVPVRVLADHQGLLPANSFYEASRRFTQQYPAVLSAILNELAKTGAWATQHPQQVAGILSGQLHMPEATLLTWQQRVHYGVTPVTPDIVGRQQEIADLFFQQKLIPKAVRISDRVWLWSPASTTTAGTH